MLRIVTLLNTNYSKDSDIEDISDDCVAEFVNEMNFDSFADLQLEAENTEIKNLKWEDRKEAKLNLLITFVYSSPIDFPQSKFETNIATELFWGPKQLSIGGSNLKNVQQSLSSLAKNANEIEKTNIRQLCERFIESIAFYSLVFNSLLDKNKNWVLDYLCGGKGIIPYELIKAHKDLNCVPEGDFFTKTEFYSSPRNEIIYGEYYENLKKIWRLLRLTKLSDLMTYTTFRAQLSCARLLRTAQPK